MSLTTAFRAQDIAARTKQTEAAYTERARNLMGLSVYPAVATWFSRKYNELLALNVRGAALGIPTGNGKSDDRIWYESTTLVFKPENEHWNMLFGVSLCTRMHNTYVEGEANRETSLRLSFTYDGYGGTVQVLYAPFELDEVRSSNVHSLLDHAWSHLDQYALEKLGDSFWSTFVLPRSFRRGLQVKDTRY